MNKIKHLKETIKLIKKEWGANCKTVDIDDFGSVLEWKDRCAECRARETIEFLKLFISFIEEDENN